MTTRYIYVRGAVLCAAAGAMLMLGVASGFAPSQVVAAEDKEGVRDILFDTPQLNLVSAGETLKYNFVRDASEPKLLGPNFTDEIKVDVAKVSEEGRRDVDVQIFSGDRGRDVRHLPGMTANPVLVFYLDRAVANYALLAGGSKGYLKNRFRLALRTTAKIEPAKLQYNGKTVDGHHVWVTPYVNDPNKEKMSGYEKARFDVFVSDKVPGYLVEMKSHFESPEPGAPKLDERIVLDGAGDEK